MARCKLTPAQVRELEAVLDAGPAVWGWDEDQCWTLARIAELVRRRFRVEYTLAGLDLLLHRIGWSVQVPARRAAERDEAADRRLEGGDLAGDKRTAADLGAWLVFEDESGQGLRPPEGPHLGTARPDPGGDGDRRQQQAGVAGRADRRQARAAAPADLPRAPRPPLPRRPAQGVHRDGLRPAAGRRAPAARRRRSSWSGTT